ncbi:hypothetical protein Ae201684_011084 [Aphanomyces euteiches]|uniref:Uncharacterized protein n=1 Tax=Aphanomyces euteiches TaxID=100861 RepID=A0A6G0WW59_9STRA|nr:hypothetical protein Ae201684_011084 [Aphanomyces euteiches]
MQKTMLRCCLAVLTYVALVLGLPAKIQWRTTQEASYEPRWKEEDLDVEAPQVETTSTTSKTSDEAMNIDASVEEEKIATMESEAKCNDNSDDKEKEDVFVDSQQNSIKEDSKTLKSRETIATIVKTRQKAMMDRISKARRACATLKNQADNDRASIYALTEQILKAFKEEALKEEVVKANEESIKASNCEENEDPLDNPNVCLQTWTNSTRVLGQLKQRHEEVQDCAEVAGQFDSLRQDQTQTRQEDMGPPVDKTNSQANSSGPDHASSFSEIATTEKEDVKTTTDKKEKNDVTSGKTAVSASKRVQGDYGDHQDQNANKQRVMATRSKKSMGSPSSPCMRFLERVAMTRCLFTSWPLVPQKAWDHHPRLASVFWSERP